MKTLLIGIWLGFSITAKAQPLEATANTLQEYSEALYQKAEEELYENFRYDRALVLYREAAKQDHTEAKYKLSKLLQETTPYGWNSSEAIFWYRSAAKDGHIEAQFDLASLKYELYKSESEIGSEVEALYWHEKLAQKNGHTLSQFFLAEMLAKGLTQRCLIHTNNTRVCHNKTVIEGQIIQDNKTAAAAYWYKQAAMKGYGRAQLRLAKMLEIGDGVAQDKSQAAFWYEQTARQGHPIAMMNLAEMLSKGMTLRCFIHTNIRLCSNKGIVGGYEISDNKIMAAYWFEQAAIRGYSPAQVRLAEILETGDGVPQNKERAVALYKKVALTPYFDIITAIQTKRYDITEIQYYMMAQMHLAKMFEEEERIVSQDKSIADYWYDQIALTARDFMTILIELTESENLQTLHKANRQNHIKIQAHINEVLEKSKNIPIHKIREQGLFWYDQVMTTMEMLQKNQVL